ncbi:SDR family NAD(P)-dependent oxidoreductase [Actomonas aquatica]|uniref:SDR family oxidoreductase n=1 Tax=Actomonas aquatica TaxID=2866162 RepID=A0ABZ1C851_9BACT|nr:SDR family oxidoreductase [Opitutus sp. WL0086]WRQ87868.1 SDR family oxidoreductase [Opitutus sp. WL0086]
MPLLPKLAGKRALITAGAQGIGLAIAEALLEAGCDVFVHYHSSATGSAALATRASHLDRRFAAAAADLTAPGSGDELVASAAAELGGIDLLINNAGSLIARHDLAEIDDGFWERVMSLNMQSMMRVTRAALPHLTAAARQHGGASIVNLASLAGRKGGHGGSLAYATAKGAVLTFTRALAAELGPVGIRVNALAPGLILGTAFHNTHTTDDSARATIAAIPLGRAGTAADVARAAVYLASEYDGFITGATLDVNGGVWCG